MTRLFLSALRFLPALVAAIGAVTTIPAAGAHGATATFDGAKMTKPMRVKHPAPGAWQRSYDRFERFPEPIRPPVNLFETGRPPAQPGQW
mgnify:CR=1 FL=1